MRSTAELNLIKCNQTWSNLIREEVRVCTEIEHNRTIICPNFFVSLIVFYYQTQSNLIRGLSLIGFDLIDLNSIQFHLINYARSIAFFTCENPHLE